MNIHPIFCFLICSFIGTACGAVGGSLLTVGFNLPFELAGPFAIGGSLVGCFQAFAILADGDETQDC